MAVLLLARRVWRRLRAKVRHAYLARCERVTAETWDPDDIDRW